MLSLEQPDQAPCDAGTYRKGETLYESSTAGYLKKTAAKGDEVIAIVAESVVDDKGILRTIAAGERVAVWRLGCQKTVPVRSLTGVTWGDGDMAYQDATAGQISKTASTSRPIGHYPYYGYAAKTTVEQISGVGVLVPITLDVAIGTTNV